MMHNYIRGFIVCAVCLTAKLYGQAWQQGSVAFTNIEGGVQLSAMGGAPLKTEGQALPIYSQGLFTSKNGSSDRIMLMASNGVIADYRGAGYFSIERFEQQGRFEGEWLEDDVEPGQSRMIFNLRQGTLVLGQRKLAGPSQLIVETPIGRISASKGVLWMVEMTQDSRKRTFDFNIHCFEGAIHMTDLTGRVYTIRSGQRISGAGDAKQPSIEVAEITSDAVESLGEYKLRRDLLVATEFSEEALLAAMKPLPSRLYTPVEVDPRAATSSVRPVLIEYVPRAEVVTPFRGVAKPPSAYEVDLF